MAKNRNNIREKVILVDKLNECVKEAASVQMYSTAAQIRDIIKDIEQNQMRYYE